MKMMRIIVYLAFVFGIQSVAFAQTTLNMSRDLVRLGIGSANMTPNQPSLDSGPLFNNAVQYAQTNQIGKVVADPGAYYLASSVPGAAVNLYQVDNMTIDLQGADLYVTNPLSSAIGLANSTNTILQNFTIDHNPPSFTQVDVVSVDPLKAQVGFTAQPGWQDPNTFNNVVQSAGGTVEVHIFRNGQPAPGLARLWAQIPISGNTITIFDPTGFGTASVLALIRPGDVAVLAMRTGGALLVVNGCTGCSIRNITTYSNKGAGVNVGNSQSTVLERVYAIPRPGTDSLVSNFGIILSASGVSNNTVRLSRAIRTLDDGLSFVVFVDGVVQSQPSGRTLVIQEITGSNLPGIIEPDGSTVAFEVSDGTILATAVTTSHIAAPTVTSPYQVTFNFDRDLPRNLVGTMMFSTNPNWRGANTVMERNAVEEQSVCCRGVSIWGLMNSVFRGNYVYRSAMTGVQLYQHLIAGDWVVPPVVNLSVSHNVIDDTNRVHDNFFTYEAGGIETFAESAQVMTASPHQEIAIGGNFIADPKRSAVWVLNTNGGSVNGNYFLNPNNYSDAARLPPPLNADADHQPVAVHISQNVSASNNTVDQTSGRIFVTGTQYNELAAYAPGSVIKLNAYNLGGLANPSVTLTDADGATTPVLIEDTADHALDVRIPAGAGLGGAYLTATSGDTTYFGTLFLDSQDNLPALNGCTYQVSPSTTSAPSDESTISFLVVTPPGCAYQVLASDSFVSVEGPAVGTGIATVNLAENAGATRTTTIEIAGQPVTLTQAGVVSESPASPGFSIMFKR
jgi:hypothetical protein